MNKIENNEEIWKAAILFDKHGEEVPAASFYEVSNIGRIRRIKTKRFLAFSVDDHGYHVVKLYKSGFKQFSTGIHRLVACTFLGEPPFPGAEVNHKDEDKANNRIENLEWCDRLYNCRYGTLRERHSKRFSGSGNPMYHKDSWAGMSTEQRADRAARYSKAMRGKNAGKCHWNDGVHGVFQKECPGPGWVRGLLRRKK